MRPAIRLFIVAAICLHLQTVSSFLSFRSKFSKNLNLFKEEINQTPTMADFTTNTSPTFQSTDIYDEPTPIHIYDEPTPIHIYDDVTATEYEVYEESEVMPTESPVSEIIYIEFTPDEYKEYYIAVKEYRYRQWNSTDNIVNDEV
jgi:hypothetical protein